MKAKLCHKIIGTVIIGMIMVGTNYKEAFAVTEGEYLEVVESAKKEAHGKDIETLDGISINEGEEVNLAEYASEHLNKELVSAKIVNNEANVKLDNNIAKGLKDGSGFVLLEDGDKAYILEILVNDDQGKPNVLKSNFVNRDYYKVFVDPGHGGTESGAAYNGIAEEEMNLTISNKVTRNLKALGVEVVMSRTDDSFVGLAERGELANEYGADVFVSVHQNSFTSPSAHGIETYHHRDKAAHKPYAQDIQSELIKNTGAYNRGVKTAGFAVLRESNMPSALVECGFISNVNEANKLKTDAYQEKVAKSISDGVYEYLTENIVLQESAFSDIKGHFAESSIEKFTDLGYLQGYGDGTFRPSESITRAEFIKIVNRVFNYTAQANESFTDVNSGYWYYEEVRKAIKAGYINVENETFRPNDTITREEAAVVITNIMKNKDMDLDKIYKYSDSGSISQWAITSVEGAIEEKYMGQNITEFRPKASLSRGEAVLLLDRVKG